jgi:hypothetical protein
VSGVRRRLRRCPHRSPTSEGADRARVTARPVPLSWGRQHLEALCADRRAPSSDLRAPPGVYHPASRPTVTQVLADPGSCHETEPLQSSSRPSGGPHATRSFDRAAGSGSRRFVAPRRRHLIGPRMRRTVRVRHGSALGVSTPSAASWLDRASEPCNQTSQPSCAVRAVRACSPFRASPVLAQGRRVGRGPLVEAAGSLAVRPDRLPVRRARSCHPRFHQLGRRSDVEPRRILRELGAPFQRRLAAPPPGHPGPRTPGSPSPGRSVDFEAFFPTASPCTSRAACLPTDRLAPAGALLGVLAPPEPCSRQDLEPSIFTRRGGGVPPSAALACLATRRVTPGPPRAHPSWLTPRSRSRETLVARWNRTWTTETSRSTRRRSPDQYGLGRAVLQACAGRTAALTPMTSDIASELATRLAGAFHCDPHGCGSRLDGIARAGRRGCDPTVRSPEFLSVSASDPARVCT